jgi:hypothetical protein
VRAVGELDEDHAHVARHGQQHFSKRLGLVFLACVELQLVELGQAIDEFGHGDAEALDQVGLGDAAVLHRIVQQRRHERGRVELPARAQRRHGDRMGDVGLATVAQLAQVRRVGKSIGLAHLLYAGGVEVV